MSISHMQRQNVVMLAAVSKEPTPLIFLPGPLPITRDGIDHASWRKYGYPSGFVIESTFEDSNQFIHTSSDTADKLSFEHMKEFAKLVVAFAIELSHVRAD